MSSKPKVDANGKKLKKKIKRDVAKVLNKNDLVRSNLLYMNPYLQALLDPFNVHGVRIPDSILYPSTPFTVVDRRTLTVNSFGVAFVTYGVAGETATVTKGSLVPIPIAGGGVGNFCVGMINGINATTTDLFPSVGAGQYIQFQNWDSSAAQIPATFKRVRLVAAGVAVQYIGAALESKGKYTVAFAPRNTLRALISSAFPITQVANLPGARTVPVNELKGVTALYKPLDSVSLNYVQIQDMLYDGSTVGNWESSIGMASACGGEIYVILDGVNPGDSVQVTASFCYEGIPTYSTFDLTGATTSPSDPIALSHALNTVQETPSAVAGTAHAQGLASGALEPKAPQSSGTKATVTTPHPGQGPGKSMFDKILDGVSSVASKALPILEKVAPLALSLI